MMASIGFTEDTLIYTSKDEFAAPLGVDIYKYLRDNLEQDIWVFFMLSSNFYQSAACLNEMGAAWVRQSRYFSVLLPGLTHEDRRGAINLNEQTLDLCNPVRLTELMGFFREKWGLTISDNRWESTKNSFIAKMKTLYENVKTEDSNLIVKTDSDGFAVATVVEYRDLVQNHRTPLHAYRLKEQLDIGQANIENKSHWLAHVANTKMWLTPGDKVKFRPNDAVEDTDGFYGDRIFIVRDVLGVDIRL